MSGVLLALCLGAFVAGGLGALAVPGRPGRALVAVTGGLGSLAAVVLGAVVLATGTPLVLHGAFLPLTGIALRLDGLGAFFLILIGLVGTAAAIYGFGYSAAYRGRSTLAMLGATLNVLLLSLAVQVMADNALTFLLAWEVMSLAAYLAVLTEPDGPGTVRAANWYLVVTHVGFAALVAMFFLLAGADPSASFETMRRTALDPPTRDAVFLLALLGFGAKAGIVPLHVWLPMAHPVAPSHVSALMSGVVIKMGVYGFVRVIVDVLGGGPAWWGAVTLALGAISALLGVLYALMEHDLKRLLAYHSVENIGIIVMGVGAGLVFQSHGLSGLAALGLVGGLYHTINHACFKGLLFLGAGSVLHGTGTGNMEALGGLIKRMPRTALAFLVGSAAIAALPPLNGFVSEWLVFQALLGGARVPQVGVAVLMPIAVAMLALTSGLAAACFVKAFGITFLALPRSRAAEGAHEAGASMQAGMALLVVACVVLGVGAFGATPVVALAIAAIPGMPAAGVTLTAGLSLGGPDASGVMSPAAIALALATALVLVPVALRLLGAGRGVRSGDTWGCGRIGQTPRMQYTATAFAEPLRRIFAELYRPTEDLSIDFHPESRYFVQRIHYTSDIRPWFETALYDPAIRLLRALGGSVRWVQAGSLHLYLLYMSVGLLILLLGARWLP
jgi:hydrogenase-4 component B